MSNGYNYTAKDFERYHNGGMTAAEMHQLEKAALNDPMLADALDGAPLRGRVPMGRLYCWVALVACARKLLIYANTVVQRGTPWITKQAQI